MSRSFSSKSYRPSSFFIREESGDYRRAASGDVLQAARYVLAEKVRKTRVMDSPVVVKEYLGACLGLLEHEVFAVLFLDAQHRVIEFREMFRGTVSQTSVYAREVVKEALQLNAASAIFAHNHPSGDPRPSRADEALTRTLKDALAIVDVRVLDHLVVGGADCVSFAECGLL